MSTAKVIDNDLDTQDFEKIINNSKFITTWFWPNVWELERVDWIVKDDNSFDVVVVDE